MIEASVRLLLLQGDLLGVGQKVFTWEAPEGVTGDWVVTSRMGEEIFTQGKGKASIRNHTVQVAYYTLDPAVASGALKKIEGRMENFQGTVGAYWIQSCVKTIELVSEKELATKRFAAIQQYDIAYWPTA